MKGEGKGGERKLAARALRELAATLERASPEELNALVSGRATLRIVPHGSDDTYRAKRTKHVRLLGDDRSASFDAELVKRKLANMTSREDGRQFLQDSSFTKKELTILAQAAGAAVMKTDNIDRLIEKIVELCIGSRLSSIVIRGQ